MVAATLRESRRLQMRAGILDAARRTYGALGVAAATTQDVAEEAGVSHGSVFAHFKSRPALICALVERVLDEAEATLAEPGPPGLGLGLGEALMTHLAALSGIEPVYARLVVERLLLPPSAQARMARFDAAVARRLHAAVGGGLREGVRPYFAFNAWMGLVAYYLANRAVFSPGGVVLRQRSCELVENFLVLVGSGPV